MAKAKSPWRNRIVGYSEEEPDQLLANPSNWRIHPAAQQNALSGVLKEVGLVQNVVANRTTGHLVDGHLRVMLAMRENQPVVPVTWVELSEEEEHLILASLDPLAAMATADAGALDALLSSVQSGEAAVQQMLAELAEDAGLYQPKDTEDAEPQIDRAEELRVKWGVESGQLWRLPSRTPGQEHRLICGDCLEGDALFMLLADELVDVVVTDPPYAIYGSSTGIGGDVTDNNMVRPFMRGVAHLLAERTRLGGHIYIFCDWRSYATWFEEINKQQLKIRNCIVWDKGDGGLGAMYTMRHEFVVFAERDEKSVTISAASKGRKARTVNGRANVQRFNVPQNDERMHNAAKPLALLSVFIDASSDEGDALFDPFLGSGTTIIAAENLSRQCRACEISAPYVSVALQRYLDAFGIRAELVE